MQTQLEGPGTRSTAVQYAIDHGFVVWSCSNKEYNQAVVMVEFVWWDERMRTKYEIHQHHTLQGNLEQSLKEKVANTLNPL